MRLLLLFLLFQTIVSQYVAGQSSPTTNRQVITGMVLKTDKTAFDSKAFLENLKTDWSLMADSVSEKDGTLVFLANNAIVMVAYMEYPVKTDDLAGAAQISWLWKNAEAEAPRHQSHLIVSVIGAPGQSVALYRLFTKIAAAALDVSEASGIFMNNQFLLVPKGYYIESARNMGDAQLPIYLWVYFGLLKEQNQHSGYTYGLREFGLPEMEIVNSDHTLQEVHAFLYDTSSELLLTGRRLQDGEKIPAGDNGEAMVQVSSGKFLEETTIKLMF